MATRDSVGVAHAPGVPTFELHTLGWRAFQDLCVVVLRELWGQSAQPFADSRDGGRDGTFYGTWVNATKSVDVPDGPFVFQCKFLARRDQTLTLSGIADELSKVKALVSRGMCNSYVLMTNARVTGASEGAIRDALVKEGVVHPLVLGGSWLAQTIALHQRLRMFVPRVYGLGDLSQILDERAYGQARALLCYLQEDLSTFVVTDAYRRAACAVEAHGFCLLLGEPAVGKSVIAATLAMTAIDRWHSLTVRADGPADIVDHWNPHEPNQFFWVDDAFGSVRHERMLTDDWARRMPKVMAAVQGGAKVVLTSRDYIYRDARRYLKGYAFPLLHEQQIVIDVADLTCRERRQILYNHIRLGDQPIEIRRALKPLLRNAADQDPFRPEVARRLGRQAFTRGLTITRASVQGFISKPNLFLQDIYEGLEPDHIAAMAMVYQAGELRAPLERLSREQESLLALIGSAFNRAVQSLLVLEGTFLRRSAKPGAPDSGEFWSFRHPTLREGFAAFIAGNPNLLELFINDLDEEVILKQLDCGSGDAEGTLVAVPAALYKAVAARVVVAHPWKCGPLISFLTTRCSPEFLTVCLELDSNFIEQCLEYHSARGHILDPVLLARLHQAGALPEHRRKAARDWLSEFAVDWPDAEWLNPAVARMLSEQELVDIRSRVRKELIPNLHETLHNWERNEQGESADEYYQPLQDTLNRYLRELSDDRTALEALTIALEQVDRQRTAALYWRRDEYAEYDHLLPEPNNSLSLRDVFDDVDQ